MKKLKLKSGFTLVELMVFFIFISLLMAAATPIITKRVKNLPIKIHHGKFVCYGDRYEYYNATKLISSGAGCKFTPPKRATLFKIELVGGGAGGYSYTQFWEDNDTRTGGYDLKSGHYGDGYTDPTDGQLRYILENAPFTWATKSTGGTSGESVTMSYVGIGSPHISIQGSCQGSCWTDHWGPWYDCIKTRKVKKQTGTDEEGNPIYTEVEEQYESTCRDWIDDNPDNLILCSTCSNYRSTANNLASKISSQRNCGTGVTGAEWCYTIATSGFVSGYQSQAATIGNETGNTGILADFGAGTSATGSPERGGYGLGMYIDGKIDFKDYKNGGKKVENSEVRSYLSQLFGTSYQKGTTSASGSCGGWGYNETKKSTVSFGSHDLMGENGNDVLHYNALKGWEACATNCRRAKGGRGGWIDDNYSTITGSYSDSSPIQRDKDAQDICGHVNGPYAVKEGNTSDRIPSVTTKTELNVRHHQVGNGGGSASYKVAYVSSLADDCVFNVSSGGPAINESISDSQLDDLHNSLTTSLVCNEGTLRLDAEGGYYNKSFTQKDYAGFDYLTPDGESTAPGSFTTSAEGGTSPYSPKDVFTKYILGSSGFGAGGSGSKIVDGCTKPWGEYWINRVYGSSVDKTSHHQIPRTECDEKAQISTTGGSSGSAGVIIISW